MEIWRKTMEDNEVTIVVDGEEQSGMSCVGIKLGDYIK